MTNSVPESRKAFHELLDLLRELDERYAGPEWGIAKRTGQPKIAS